MNDNHAFDIIDIGNETPNDGGPGGGMNVRNRTGHPDVTISSCIPACITCGVLIASIAFALILYAASEGVRETESVLLCISACLACELLLAAIAFALALHAVSESIRGTNSRLQDLAIRMKRVESVLKTQKESCLTGPPSDLARDTINRETNDEYEKGCMSQCPRN